MSTLSGGPNIVTNGLVLWLDAANPKSYASGSTTWNDISRGGNNGTLVNGPTFNTGSGGSIVFDGTNDYVNCGNSTTFNISQHSICFWFYPKQSSIREIIYKAATAASSPGPYEVYQYNNNIAYRLNNTSSPSTTQIGTVPLTLNRWHHISATYDNVTMKTYINSILDINTSFATTLATTTGALNIGAYTDGGYPMLANLASVQVYNRTLSAQEVLQNYNSLKSRFGLT
jgi:hypothetical protein